MEPRTADMASTCWITKAVCLLLHATEDGRYLLYIYRKFQVGCPECKTAKVSRDLDPPPKLSRDNLDSSHVILCSFAFRVWTEQAT